MKKEFSCANVIVTFNRKRKLLKAINSLLKQSLLPKYIIIIDNNSTDGTKAFLNEKKILSNKRIKYFKLKKNLGGSGGFRFAVEKAKNFNVDWIGFGDDDAYYQQDFWKKIAKVSSERPNIKAFTGTVKLNDGRIDISHRIFINDWGMLRYKYIPKKYYKKNFFVDMFTFVGSVVNTEIIKKIGNIKSEYFIWIDDLEFSVRVREQTKIINVTKALVLHDTNQSAMDFKNNPKADWRYYYEVRNKIDMCACHGKSFRRNLYPVAILIKNILKFFSSKYKGHKIYDLRQTLNAIYDAKHKKFGKSLKYNPNN